MRIMLAAIAAATVLYCLLLPTRVAHLPPVDASIFLVGQGPGGWMCDDTFDCDDCRAIGNSQGTWDRKCSKTFTVNLCTGGFGACYHNTEYDCGEPVYYLFLSNCTIVLDPQPGGAPPDCKYDGCVS